MKLCRYILAVFISIQIILLGAGQTRVFYQCLKCAKTTSGFWVKVERGIQNGGSCSCGSGGCSCDEGNCACQGEDQEVGKENAACGSEGCSTVKVHKLEIPTLSQSFCLDQLYFSSVQLCFDPFISSLLYALPERQKNFLYYDTAAPLPKVYLNMICVLLI